jgi:hypothetical protein
MRFPLFPDKTRLLDSTIFFTSEQFRHSEKTDGDCAAKFNALKAGCATLDRI